MSRLPTDTATEAASRFCSAKLWSFSPLGHHNKLKFKLNVSVAGQKNLWGLGRHAALPKGE